MPFNPQEAAQKLGLQQNIQVEGSNAQWDPHKTAAGLGLDTSIPVQSGPSKAESFARGAAQGATMSFGDELTSGVDAAVEKIRELGTGSTSLAPGKGLNDKYQAALEQNRGQNKAAAEANPLTSIGGQLVGAMPAAIAGGSSVLSRAITGATMGGLNSLGSSENQSAGDAALKAGKSAALAGGLSLLFDGGIKLAGSAIKALTKGPVAAGSMAYNLEKSLTNPQVAQQLGQEIDDTGAKFAQLSQESRNQIGQNLDSVAARTNARVDPNPTLKSIVDKLDAYDPGRNVAAQGTKADLKDAVVKISEDLFQKADQGGTVSFADLHKIKQTLSQTVFDQGLYKDSPYVDKLAKQLYSGIASTLKTADQSGEYSSLSKVYQTLSSSDPNAFSANALKYLQDPWDVNARGRLGRLLGDMQGMAPELRDHYLPKLASFIDNDFQNAAIKAELLKTVGGKTGAMALKGIPLPNPSAIASDIGGWAGSTPLKPILNSAMNAGESARSLIPIEGPIAGPTMRGLGTVGASNLSTRHMNR